jgi:hypothetical protein
MSWHEFDRQQPEVREELRDEIERFFAEADLQCFRSIIGEAHPNADYEYQPIITVLRGNYRR